MMKNKFLLAALTLPMFFAACSQDELISEENAFINKGGDIKVALNVDREGDILMGSRAEWTGGGLAWKPADMISMYWLGKNDITANTALKGHSNAVFKSDAKGENFTSESLVYLGNNAVVYPADVAHVSEKNIEIVVELPIKAGNEYQEKTTSINVLVEAVQGNADVVIDGDATVELFGGKAVADADGLVATLESGENVLLKNDVKIDPAGMSNAYGTTGINVKNGQTIDGGGHTLDIKGAGGTWDSGINTTGGLIKNLTVTGSFRGIFINHNSTHSEKVVLENVIIDGTTYTISCDQGTNQGLEAINSTFNGWTSYAETLGEAKFVNCNFGKGNGYAYCRPYAPTTFIGCNFEAGYTVNPIANVIFENCTIGGVALTEDNIDTLVTSTDKVTVK